jgi:hypothetical protein
VRARRPTTAAGPRLSAPRCRGLVPRLGVSNGGPDAHRRAPQAVGPLGLPHSSGAHGGAGVQEAGRPPRGGPWERPMRRARLDPLRDAVTPGMRGEHTEDRPPAAPSPAAVPGARGSHPWARAAARPVSEALRDAAGAGSIRWYPGEPPAVGGGPLLCGAGVAIVAESPQSPKRDAMGEVPAATGNLWSAHTQERPQPLTGLQGSNSDAPEGCREAGHCGTVGVNGARTGLGGPVGQPPALPGT